MIRSDSMRFRCALRNESHASSHKTVIAAVVCRACSRRDMRTVSPPNHMTCSSAACGDSAASDEPATCVGEGERVV